MKTFFLTLFFSVQFFFDIQFDELTLKWSLWKKSKDFNSRVGVQG